MKILSSFTHPQVVPSLCEFLCSAEHKGRYSEECGKTEPFWGTIDFHSIFFPTMEVNGAPKQPGYKLSSKYLPLCSAEQINLYRFGTTWGWVNDDRIFVFGWTIPLIVKKSENLSFLFRFLVLKPGLNNMIEVWHEFINHWLISLPFYSSLYSWMEDSMQSHTSTKFNGATLKFLVVCKF